MTVVALAEIADQIRGVSYGKTDVLDRPAEGFLPVLRANNITDDGLSFDDLVYVRAEKVSAKQQVRSGDIVIAASSGSISVVGKAAQADDDLGMGFGAFCKVVRPSPKVHARYIGHFFKTQEYRRKMSALAAGANINNLKNEHIDQLEIPLPPIEEQKRIAAILDQADELRRKRQRAIDRLNQLGQAIFHEMFGDPATNPKGWPVGTIRDLIAEAKYGTAKKANTEGLGTPILRMGNLSYDGQIDLSDIKYVELAGSEFKKYTTKFGDILFNRTNSKELVGKTAVVMQDEPLAIAGYLVRARANNKGNPFYISAYLNSPHGKATLRSMCKNIVGMANINAQEFQNILIAKPPKDRQDQFQEAVLEIEGRKAPLRDALAKSESLFSSVQHRAFRGEL